MEEYRSGMKNGAQPPKFEQNKKNTYTFYNAKLFDHWEFH